MNAITETIAPDYSRPIEFSGDTKVLFPAFLKAQQAMGEVLKTSSNSHFKSKYADLAAVIEAVLPALHANGFGLMQPPHSDGDIVQVETLLVHESGGYIRSCLGLRPSKSDPQGVGSAVTYGRRYALQSIAGIAPEDDDGNAASGPRQVAQPQTNSAVQGRTRQSLAVTAALSAIIACENRAEMKAWKVKNEAMLADLGSGNDYDAILNAFNHRWAHFAPAKPDEPAFRDRSASGMAGNNRPAPQAHDLIPEDEIPY